MSSTSAARVVEVPEACWPHTRTSPRRNPLQLRTTSGRPSSSKVGMAAGTSLSTAATESRCTNAETRKRPWPGIAWGDDSSPERSEEHTSELQSLMRISYAVFCLKQTKHITANDV